MGQYTYHCDKCPTLRIKICSYADSFKVEACACGGSYIRDEIAEVGAGSGHSDKKYRAKINLSDGTSMDTPAAFKNGLLWY